VNDGLFEWAAGRRDLSMVTVSQSRENALAFNTDP